MRRAGVFLSALLLGGCASSTIPSLGPSAPGPVPPAPASLALPTTAFYAAAAPGAAVAAPATDAALVDPDPAEAAAMMVEGEPDEGAPPTQEEIRVGDEIDDDAEAPLGVRPEAGRPQPPVARSPLLELSDAEVNKRVGRDLASLGSLSVGSANSGALVNGVRMQSDDRTEIVDAHHAWGTQETLDYLRAAQDAVYRAHPDSPRLRIGHLSAQRGGKLVPHKSHQSGRDVDTSYYYKADQPFRWYRPANADNLDRARTWTFVRALLTDTDVEWIFINTSVQKLLKEYALSIGEDREWLDSVFQYGSRHPWPLIRHAHGHDTHIHVRFYNPVAQELGRRSYGALVAAGRIQAPIYYQRHRAQKGEILSRIARRYGVTIQDIQKANKLRSTLIRAGQEYLIPRTGQVAPAAKLVVPPRRLPPEGSARAARRVAGPQDG